MTDEEDIVALSRRDHVRGWHRENLSGIENDDVNLLRKVQLQIAVNEEFVEPTINAVLKAGRSSKKGEIGDGKIFVLPLEDCIRIRTGERGPDAI